MMEGKEYSEPAEYEEIDECRSKRVQVKSDALYTLCLPREGLGVIICTMQRKPEKNDIGLPKSRPTSRRNSASTPRRSSIMETKSPASSAPGSANSTPKKVVKPPLDFIVTGRQMLRKCDRANSLPGSSRRGPAASMVKISLDSPKRADCISQASNSQATVLEDYSLDLSQISDFEQTSSNYGIKHKFNALATSTPKSQRTMQKQRIESESQMPHNAVSRKNLMSLDSSLQSGDSLYKTPSSASTRYGTDLEYSSMSPEYSGQSSTDPSPRAPRTDLVTSPISQDLQSCCVSSFQDASENENTKIEDLRPNENGEWSDFWANYNNSLSKVPMKNYDQCPTPFRTEDIELTNSDFSRESSRIRSPDNIRHLNNIICNEGLHLTPRETQNLIKCAHILNNVLSKAIERRSKEKIDEIKTLKCEREGLIEEKKRTMTLDLKETHIPMEVKEEKRCETVTTQTDISLPNTKSAPIIFENILRQLSKSSIDENKTAETQGNNE